MTVLGTIEHNYADTAVTTAAWVELAASVGVNVKEIQIFDSSGSILQLGVGVDAEVLKMFIMPGGNTQLPCTFAQGDKLSLKALDANATSGRLVINLIG